MSVMSHELRVIRYRYKTTNSDGTLTPELMAVNPESLCRTSKVATISHGPSVRQKKNPHQTRIHVSLSLNTIESLFNLAKYRFWSGEANPGVRRPVFIRVRTAYSIAAT